MAGPNEDDNPGHRQQTGTRPKSRTNTSPRNTSLSSVTGAGGSHQALLSLMREYQAVTESLALARDQIEREGQRVVTRRNQETQRRRLMSPKMASASLRLLAFKGCEKASGFRERKRVKKKKRITATSFLLMSQRLLQKKRSTLNQELECRDSEQV